MSLSFSDTTSYKGIVQIYEKEIGAERGFISGNTTRLKEFAADVNLAFDDFLVLALQASGTWQFDDSNHTDYPIITTNLVASQRDYTFTSDEGGNLVLDIYRVYVKQSSDGYFEEVKPVDVQSEPGTADFTSGQDVEGIPYRYDKTANGIFLDPIPSTSITNGLKVYINREPSYFTSTDTTKKPGVPGIFHRYFALRPAFEHARRSNLSNVDRLGNEVAVMEQNIEEYFGRREKDKRHVLTGNTIIYR